MIDLLCMTAFICSIACLQYRCTNKTLQNGYSLMNVNAKKNQYHIWFVVGMLVMMTLVALRGTSIGNDTEEYRNIFFKVNNDSSYLSSARYEAGYLYLNRFIGYITDEPQVLFVILAGFQYTVFTWFILKYSDDLAFSLILVFILIFSSSMNIVRQVTAMAFILIGADRLLQKRTIRSFIWLTVAVFFHFSSIIFLAIPLMSYIKFNRIIALCLLIAVLICTTTDVLYIISSKLFPKYAHYFSGSYADSGRLAILYQTLRNGVLFAISYYGVKLLQKDGIQVLYKRSKIESDRQNNLTLWCSFFCFIGIIFGFRLNLVDRIVAYVVSFYVIVLPNSMKKMNSKTRMIIKLLIIVISLVYMITVQVYRPSWNRIYPYQFFWQS